MKPQICCILGLCIAAAINHPLRLMAQQAEAEVRVEETQPGTPQGTGVAPPQDVRIEAMEEVQEEIAETLEISAPMELELESGVDPVIEAMEKGLIIETTLEEVHAAIAAAEATPDPEDDIAAFEMKCRGSYRFFLDPAPTHPRPVEGDAPDAAQENEPNQPSSLEETASDE